MEKHFVVKEHQANYTIGNLEPEDLFNFLNQSIQSLKDYRALMRRLVTILKKSQKIVKPML